MQDVKVKFYNDVTTFLIKKYSKKMKIEIVNEDTELTIPCHFYFYKISERDILINSIEYIKIGNNIINLEIMQRKKIFVETIFNSISEYIFTKYNEKINLNEKEQKNIFSAIHEMLKKEKVFKEKIDI